MRRPLAIGDPVLLHLNGTSQPAKVLDMSSWAWILVQSEQGQLYLEVVMNASAVSWSRLVQLADTIEAHQTTGVSRIAEAVAYKPNRKHVRDVCGAEVLLPPQDRIERLPEPGVHKDMC